MTGIVDLVASLPKAELHLHIEGTFEPELMFAVAKRNAIPLPYGTVDEVRAAHAFSNLQDFLDICYAGAGMPVEARDFHDLPRACLTRAHAQNVHPVRLARNAFEASFLDQNAKTAHLAELDAVAA